MEDRPARRDGEDAGNSGLANSVFPAFSSPGFYGMWRSLVARLHGVQEVAGSNPVIPTIF
jgi:hypothetical protein